MPARSNNSSSEERAYFEIMRMILSQELPPGTPIMESVIVEKLKMSRTPIRSALRRLVSSGLLEFSANRSASVPILTRKDWDNLFELRLMIEPKIAELAAANYKKDNDRYFLDLLEAEKSYTDDEGLSIQDINEKLHFGIAELADNKYLYSSLQTVFWRCQLYVCFFDSFLCGKTGCVNRRLENPLEVKSVSQHEEMVNAVLEKNPERAGEVMKEHVISTYKRASTFVML